MPLVLAIVAAVLLLCSRRSRRSIAVGHPGPHDAPREPRHHRRHRAHRRGVLLATFGEVPRSYAGISEHAWDVGGVLVQPQYVLIAAVAIVAAVGLTFFLRRTIVGQALVASADSPRAAELVGLNVRSIAVIAFAVAGCALRPRRRPARADRPGRLQRRPRADDQRLRRRGLRRLRLDPARAARRLRARDRRAARRRLRRPAVQPHDRARRRCSC